MGVLVSVTDLDTVFHRLFWASGMPFAVFPQAAVKVSVAVPFLLRLWWISLLRLTCTSLFPPSAIFPQATVYFIHTLREMPPTPKLSKFFIPTGRGGRERMQQGHPGRTQWLKAQLD